MSEEYKKLPSDEVIEMLANIRLIVELDLAREIEKHGGATPRLDCEGCFDLLIAMRQLMRLYKAGWVIGPSKEALAAGWTGPALAEAMHYAGRGANDSGRQGEGQ